MFGDHIFGECLNLSSFSDHYMLIMRTDNLQAITKMLCLTEPHCNLSVKRSQYNIKIRFSCFTFYKVNMFRLSLKNKILLTLVGSCQVFANCGKEVPCVC